MPPFVKYCGLTRAEDVTAAIELGVSAIGFNFIPTSKRSLSTSEAIALRALIPSHLPAIGVFADFAFEAIDEIARTVNLSGVQFHGGEPPDLVAQFSSLITIKALPISTEKDLSAIESYLGSCSYVLLDSGSKIGFGGSGITFHHELLAKLDPWLVENRIIVAGGLTPTNVGEVLKTYRPFGVDIASGIEEGEAPGVKSRVLMEEFIAATR